MHHSLFASPAIALLSVLFTCDRASALDFAGVWVSDPQNESQERMKVEIRESKSGWLLQAWALTGNESKGLGKTSLALLGDSTLCPDCNTESKSVLPVNSQSKADDSAMPYGFAKLEYPFKDSYLTLRLEGDAIEVEDFNIFKDDSGRRNYRLKYRLKRENKRTNSTDVAE